MGFNNFRNLVRWNVDASGAGTTGTGGFSGVRLVFPVAPSMNINGTSSLGFYAVKVGGRVIQAMMRFDF